MYAILKQNNYINRPSLIGYLANQYVMNSFSQIGQYTQTFFSNKLIVIISADELSFYTVWTADCNVTMMSGSSFPYHDGSTEL